MNGIPQAFYGDRSVKVEEVGCVWEYPRGLPQQCIVPFSIAVSTHPAHEYLRGTQKGGAEESWWIEIQATRIAGSVVLKMTTSFALQGADDWRYGSSSEEMGL